MKTIAPTTSRMPKQLGDAISESFYSGRLQSTREAGEFKRLEDLPNSSVIHLDKDYALYWYELREFSSEILNRIDRERTDEDEAKIEVILAHKALATGRTVLILTPFRNQRKMIDSLLTHEELEQGIKCSTIHSAQGDEAEFVIFSMVSSDHRLLRGDKALHLHNVALSRAQEQVIIISDFLIEDNKHYQEIIEIWDVWDS
jgi:superfamily I DNA and/or RNA helicase